MLKRYRRKPSKRRSRSFIPRPMAGEEDAPEWAIACPSGGEADTP